MTSVSSQVMFTVNLKHKRCRVCVCVLPERGHVVAGGPAQDEAPLRVGASLTHLVRAACRPHLTHTQLGLLLEVVGRPGSTFPHESQRKNTHNPVLT